MSDEELKRIEAECAECLSDREQFSADDGLPGIVECDHCRDKMNLIAQLREASAALDAMTKERDEADGLAGALGSERDHLRDRLLQWERYHQQLLDFVPSIRSGLSALETEVQDTLASETGEPKP